MRLTSQGQAAIKKNKHLLTSKRVALFLHDWLGIVGMPVDRNSLENLAGEVKWKCQMGTRYIYSCPNCSRTTDVSGGGDTGWVVTTQTIHCEACGRLYDVEVSQNLAAGDPQSVTPACPKQSRPGR